MLKQVPSKHPCCFRSDQSGSYLRKSSYVTVCSLFSTFVTCLSDVRIHVLHEWTCAKEESSATSLTKLRTEPGHSSKTAWFSQFAKHPHGIIETLFGMAIAVIPHAEKGKSPTGSRAEPNSKTTRRSHTQL